MAGAWEFPATGSAADVRRPRQRTPTPPIASQRPTTSAPICKADDERPLAAGRACLARTRLAAFRRRSAFRSGPSLSRRGPIVGGNVQFRALVEHRLPARACLSPFRRHHATRFTPANTGRRPPESRYAPRFKGPLSRKWRGNQALRAARGAVAFACLSSSPDANRAIRARLIAACRVGDVICAPIRSVT